MILLNGTCSPLVRRQKYRRMAANSSPRSRLETYPHHPIALWRHRFGAGAAGSLFDRDGAMLDQFALGLWDRQP